MIVNGLTVAVTGATGQQGGAVARRLLTDGWTVRALTRDPTSPKARALAAAGADVRTVDMADPATLKPAIDGVYGVFSVQPASGAPDSPPDYSWQDEIAAGRNVADAAADAGVRHLVYASANSAQLGSGIRILENKWVIEEHIRGLGISATVLRPTSFMENYVHPVWGLRDGTLTTAIAPDVPQQLIALSDIGALAALALAHPDRFAAQALELAGDALTPPQIADVMSRATGRTVPYVRMPMETLRELSPDAAEGHEWLNDRRSHGADINALRAVHPSLMSFDTWLEREGARQLEQLLDGVSRETASRHGQQPSAG
ncbi:NmrA/HSCARG family protein [Streptomyces inhibens]|uniref:NmrA/HSCARG family protein n=1 Tax=Streptomyces inhibens TaxID=2293571 RepID=UPI0036A21CB5